MRQIILGLLLGSVAALASDDWPQFRGPGGDGISEATGLPANWSETANIRWKTSIPGRGHSSPVILSNQVWLTTATEAEHSLRALCVDRGSGKITHDVEVFHIAAPDRTASELTGMAAPTPVVEPGRVYVCFGTHGNACLDTASGRILWRHTEFIFDHDGNGPGSSPILYKDLLILTCDGTDARFMAALDKQSGKLRWQTRRSNVVLTGPGGSKSYCTPTVFNVNGRDQLVSPGAHRVSAYEPATGKEIWGCDLPGWSIVPRPIYGHGLVFVTTGGNTPELWAVRPEGPDSGTPAPVAWRYKKQVSMAPSLLLVGKELYMVSIGGILTCLDAASGKEIYAERLGGDYYASPVLAEGRMYFCNDTGQTVVVAPGPQFSVGTTNTLESGIMASPAIAGKAIYLRTKTHLYRIEQ